MPFAGGSYLAYSLLDSSIAKPPGDQLTPVYMFVSGCLAAAFAKVTYFLVTCVDKSCRHRGSFCLSTNFHTSAAFLICHWMIRTHAKGLRQVWKHLGKGQFRIRECKQWRWWWQREQQKISMLFYTFFCHHCTTMTWKYLFSQFVEDMNRRQWPSFSYPELWYSPLVQKTHQHLTKWMRWKKRGKVWSSLNTPFKWRFHSHCCCISSLLSNRVLIRKSALPDWAPLPSWELP